MEISKDIGKVANIDLKLDGGIVTLTATEKDAYGTTSLVRTLDEKAFLDLIVKSLPVGWIKSAAQAAEDAAFAIQK